MKEWFQALATPTIGLLALYIAWQQWRTNRLKVRHDLYERRLSLYLAVMEFLVAANANRATDAERHVFLQKTRESYFLFGPKTSDYLKCLYEKAVDLDCTNSLLHDPLSKPQSDQERSKLANAKAEL